MARSDSKAALIILPEVTFLPWQVSEWPGAWRRRRREKLEQPLLQGSGTAWVAAVTDQLESLDDRPEEAEQLRAVAAHDVGADGDALVVIALLLKLLRVRLATISVFGSLPALEVRTAPKLMPVLIAHGAVRLRIA